jgi:CheY-like chemotaxis protein
MEPLQLLVVDGDERVRSETAAFLSERTDAEVLTAGTLESATSTVEAEELAAVITGYNLPDGNGLELAERARADSPGTGCILYTSAESVETASFEETVVDFVPKGARDAEETLLALVEQTGVESTQAPYPVPESEGERVEAADRLGSRPELSGPLGRLARLAADRYDATGAAVSLLRRDRQELLARTGSISPAEARENTLSTFALTAEDGVMAVGDTLTDPRFVDIDAVHEAGIGAYLGATVYDPEGQAVAVLSVYDETPREFTASEEEYARLLADLGGDLIALSAGGGTDV